MCSTFAHLSQAKCLLKRLFWKSPSPKNDQSANGPYWSYCSKQPELNYEAYKHTLQSGIQIYDAMLVRRLMHFSRFELHCTLFRRFPAILSYAHKQPLLSEIIRLNLLFKIRKISIEFLKCQTTLRSERGINLKWKVSKNCGDAAVSPYSPVNTRPCKTAAPCRTFTAGAVYAFSARSVSLSAARQATDLRT